MKNMKIEVNAEQPLDEIVEELERLKYKPFNKFAVDPNRHMWLVADYDSTYLGWRDASILCDIYYKITTLSELKNMKCFDN